MYKLKLVQNPEFKLDLILYEAQVKLSNEICNDISLAKNVKEQASIAISNLNNLRKNITETLNK